MPSKKTETLPVKTSESAIDLKTKLASIKTRASALLKKWSSFEAKTAEQFELAGQATKDFASLRKELKAIVKPAIDAAKAEYDEKKRLPNEVDAILEAGEQSLRDTLIAYQDKHRKQAEIKVEKALERGDDTRAAAIAAKPYIPAVEGLSFVDRWHGEVYDLKLFLQAIIDGQVPTEAIEPNLVWLNAQARARKAEDIGVPGAKGVKETSSSIRS
jgi:hypothetical protein